MPKPLGKKREESLADSSLLYPPPPPKKEKDLKDLISLFALLLAFLIFGYHCPIYQISGIHCPGCGMTRAALCFLQGDFKASFTWHALLIPTLVFLGLFLLIHKKNPKIGQGLIWVWVGLMLIYWLYRLIFLGW